MSAPTLETLRKRISAYLIEEIEDESRYIKSRHIAAELDISVKRVGKVMATIEQEDPRVTLERWGGSSDGVTWYVRET